MNHQFVIHTKNVNLLDGIYSSDTEEGTSQDITKVLDLELIAEKAIGKGFGGAEMAITIAVSLVTGVGSGVIANFIYDKLMEKGKNKIVIKEKRMTITTKDELIEYVEKHYFND